MHKIWIKLLFIVFVVSGLLVCGFGIYRLQNALASTNWPTTEGKVSLSSMSTIFSKNSPSTHCAEILYSYSVNEVIYSSNKVTFGQYCSNNPALAQQTINKYPEGALVKVHYRPDNPNVAVLETGWRWTEPVFLLIGLFFLVIGVLGVLGKINQKKNVK